MGLFSSKSSSTVQQTTNTTNINAQGIAAPTVIGEGNRLIVTDAGATRRALDIVNANSQKTAASIEQIAGESINAQNSAMSSALGFGSDALSFADDQTARAIEVTLAAIDQIGVQNQRTIDAVSAASASTVREIATATRSEAAQLSEKVITYGTVAAVLVAIAWILK